MKPVRLFSIFNWLLVLPALALFSFTRIAGGEGFEILLKDQVLVQRFGTKMNDIQTIRLGIASINEQLVVKYYHCGQTGKNRVITLRDDHNKVLMQWKYANSVAASLISESAMVCKVSDILSLRKKFGGTMQLYYTSDEIPAGRLLAYLETNGK